MAESSGREFPDIHFVETDTETIESNMIALYEYMMKEYGRAGYKMQPTSPERLFISWCAAVIVQQRVLIDETAKKNVPRYATGEYLDSLAELFRDVERLPATPAMATFRCYISEAQPQDVTVPKGTRVTFDGNITFETEEDLVIPHGSTYGDVGGICQTSGAAGNGLAAGQVREIVDVYDYYMKAENITVTSGGMEEEGDAAFYQRMRESTESFSTAGPANSYAYHAKSVTTAISDIAVTSPEPGVVDVRVLLKEGLQPAEEVLGRIRDALNADDVRPLTDTVRVSAPESDGFEVDVTFYVDGDGGLSTAIVEQNVRMAVDEYVAWQTCKMGRDVNPSYLIHKMMEAGAKRVDVRKPGFKAVAGTHVAKLSGVANVQNGGVEAG